VSNKNGPARVKQWMQLEAPSKPPVNDSLLLPEREVHLEISMNEDCFYYYSEKK